MVLWLRLEFALARIVFIIRCQSFPGGVQTFCVCFKGELLGLKWTDIDRGNSQIYIQRTFNSVSFFSPKTKESNRKIVIDPKAMTELKKRELDCPMNESNLVFPSEAGTPMDHHHMVARYFQPTLIKAAKVPRVRFHDLRVRAKITGHSNPTVTWNVYAHLMKPANQEAACRLENTVFGESGSRMVVQGKNLKDKVSKENR